MQKKELGSCGEDVACNYLEKIGYKIREANAEQKIPIQLIIGKNEVANNEVNLRRFGSQESQTIKVEEFLEMIQKESKIVF